MIDFSTSPIWFKTIRSIIVSACTECGFSERLAGQVAMAVDEALCNIHRHGYQEEPGRARLTAKTAFSPHPSIFIEIIDEAEQVDAQTIKSRNLEEVRPGGLGVHLIQTIMDEATWTKRDSGGMRLTMRKTIPNTINLFKTEETTIHE
tara:strand:+ start:1590 stop:2033 length:444 start_codon:yes stop_codon:yes gene_type:complete